MRNIFWVLAGLVLFGAAPCDAREKLPIYIGYCNFFPTATATRDTFGKAWPQITVGKLEKKRADKWALTYDLASFRRGGDNQATLVALTMGAEHKIGSLSTETLQPYVALRAGPYYARLKADEQGVNATHIGINANAAVGVLIKERFFLEGRYDVFDRVAGFSLNGASITAGMRILDL
jgi:hypothetical protein